MGKIENPPAISDKPEDWAHMFSHAPWLSKVKEQYPYWSKAKYMRLPKDVTPLQVWGWLKLLRIGTAQSVRFLDMFTFNVPAFMSKQLHDLDMHTGGTLQSLINIPDSTKGDIIFSSLFAEAYHSSVLEGAVATREDAKAIIREQRKPLTKGERMIVNNYRAMKYIVQHQKEPLTKQGLLQLHGILAEDAMDQGEAGAYRTGPINMVDATDNEIIYSAPHAATIREGMATLVEFFNQSDSEGQYIHPLLRGAIIHFIIGYLHPFADGNGRIARALFYWHMLRNGYWLGQYLSISQTILHTRNRYYKAFLEVEADGNDLTYFLIYHTEMLCKAFENLKAYLHEKLNVEAVVNSDLASRHGITLRQAELWEQMRKHPTLWPIARAQRFLSVTYVTAQKDLQALLAKNLVVTGKIDGRTTGYRAVRKLER